MPVLGGSGGRVVHGLVNRAIQGYLRDTFGAGLWTAVAREAGIGRDGFEPMLRYDNGETEAVLQAAARLLDRPREAILEDLGTYLVSHPNLERMRRLLRFSGAGFAEFLHSLEDLPGRGRLALPDLELPALALHEEGMGAYRLTCRFPVPGAGHVMMGLLRAMADDYGALVLLDHGGTGPLGETVMIRLLDMHHSSGRRFDLTQRTVQP